VVLFCAASLNSNQRRLQSLVAHLLELGLCMNCEMQFRKGDMKTLKDLGLGIMSVVALAACQPSNNANKTTSTPTSCVNTVNAYGVATNTCNLNTVNGTSLANGQNPCSVYNASTGTMWYPQNYNGTVMCVSN
jgi:hypothetical protein